MKSKWHYVGVFILIWFLSAIIIQFTNFYEKDFGYISFFIFAIYYGFVNRDRIKSGDKKAWAIIIVFVFLGLLTLAGTFMIWLTEMQSSISQSNITGTPKETTEDYTLDANLVQYHEFIIEHPINSTISFKSNYPITVFLVKSEDDFNNFLDGLDYEIYDNCLAEKKYSGEIKCRISSGGIVVWNYNPYRVKYTLTIKQSR